MANTLHADITLATSDTVPTTGWATISGMEKTGASIAGTSSVVLLLATITLNNASADDCVEVRFAVDGSRTDSPWCHMFHDATDEGNSLTMAWAVDGLSAGTHSFAVQWLDVQGGSTSSALDRTFQVIEFESDVSLLVDISTTASAGSAPATFADIAGQSQSSVTTTASSLHLLIGSANPRGSSAAADLQFAIDGTREGAVVPVCANASNEYSGMCFMHARTGLAGGTHSFSLQWEDAGSAPALGSGDNRILQVLEFTDNFSLETDIELTSSSTAPSTWGTVTGMSDTAVAVNNTSSIVLAIANAVIDAAADETAQYKLALDSTRDGPDVWQFTDSTNDQVGHCIPYAWTNLTGPVQIDLEWQIVASTPVIDEARARTLQVIDFQEGAAPPAANPKGPFGHPLHGPFAGPIGP
jgi:hypothetical protein